MSSLSTQVRPLLAFVARRGARVEIVAAMREELGLRVLRRATLGAAEAEVALADLRARGFLVVAEAAPARPALPAPRAAAGIPAAPRVRRATTSVCSPYSTEIILATQKTRAPNR